MKYLFSGQPELRQACEHLLRVQPERITAEQLLADMVQQVSRMAPQTVMQAGQCSTGKARQAGTGC